MSQDIVVVGSLNADLVAQVPRFPSPGETVTGTSFAIYPGGKGANQACAAARLGAHVHMVGRIGDDSHGRFLDAQLVASGVDTSQIIADGTAPTGTAMITIDESGQNEIVVSPGANGELSAQDVANCSGLIERAGFVLLQLEVPLAAVEVAARLAHEAGVVVILDPAPARGEVLSLLPLVDYLTPNETELAALTGSQDDAETLLGHGTRNVVAKLGASGAQLVSATGEHTWPGLEVEAIDTTAAGDVWNGAFAAALAAGQSVVAAGAFANAAAALSVTRAGAQPSMPTRAEVKEFIARRTA
jgi:ribokinase